MDDQPKDRNELTKKFALEAFDYVDGSLIWKERPLTHFIDAWRQRIFNRRQAGKKAGTIVSGYEMVNLKFGRSAIHRIVFLMHHGYMPEEVDHIDGNSLNNRIENLRAATHAENSKNVGLSKANTSGRRGVSLHKDTGKWIAYIRHEGKLKHLGLFHSFEDACAVRTEAEKQYYGEFRRDR